MPEAWNFMLSGDLEFTFNALSNQECNVNLSPLSTDTETHLVAILPGAGPPISTSLVMTGDNKKDVFSQGNMTFSVYWARDLGGC